MFSVDHISKSFSGKTVLHPLSHTFRWGETTAIIGPSGCGKTTLLRILLGLIAPDSGTVSVHDERMENSNEDQTRLRIGYVVQEGGLFPHLTAHENVALMSRWLGRSRVRTQERIEELARLVRLDPELLGNYPARLSGGQRQRVALMRALMLDPAILLMDEPLGALDPMIRFELQNDLKEIFARLNKTVVMVTHDMNEAAFFADEIVLMRDGHVVQRGALDDLLSSPNEDFVGDFIRAQRADPRLASL